MRIALVLLFTLTLAALALANPYPEPNQVHFDVGNGSNCIWPNAGDLVTVTVFLDEFGSSQWEGLSSIGFQFYRTFEGFKLSQTNLLGGPDFGDVEVDGWMLTSGEDCAEPDADDAIPLGEVVYLYFYPGLIELLPHPQSGYIFTYCNDDSDWWVHSETDDYMAGLGMEPPSGCTPTPVSDVTWGTVKAVFR
jgi:hypothetical protein